MHSKSTLSPRVLFMDRLVPFGGVKKRWAHKGIDQFWVSRLRRASCVANGGGFEADFEEKCWEQDLQ